MTREKLTAVAYSMAVEEIESFHRFETNTPQVLIWISRVRKEAERRIRTQNGINKTVMNTVRPMDLELVEWEANRIWPTVFVSTSLIRSLEFTNQELGTIACGGLSHKDFQGYVFCSLRRLHVLTEPDISKATIAELVENTVPAIIAKKVAKMDRMVAARFVIEDFLQSERSKL
jgi:hypothetical protein